MPSLCSVTGNMQTLSGGGLPQGTVNFQLMNIAVGTIPQVTGTALLPQTQYKVQTALDGSFAVNLWGNDNITPVTTFYGVTFRDVAGNELGPILFFILGSSVNLNTLAAASGGALALQSPAITGTVTGSATYISPGISGTPTGTGIATFTLKTGSGGGTYSSTSASYVDIDGTNLSYTVTVPIGWKALVTFTGVGNLATSNSAGSLCIADSTTTLIETGMFAADSANKTISLQYVFVGDGFSHIFKPRYKADGTHSIAFLNSSATIAPTMTVLLVPSN